jgi:hypothetical protein
VNRKLALATAAIAVALGAVGIAGASNASAGTFAPLASTSTIKAATDPISSNGGVQADGSILWCVNTTVNSATRNIPYAPGNGVSCPTPAANWLPVNLVTKAYLAAHPGAKGDKGDTGATGATGAKGDTGAAGTNAQALPYGIALVNVSRGGATATTWGTFSTTIGSPVGDTASGVFRMSCSAAKAPCVISVQAYSTTSGVTVYPRLDISRQDTNNAPTGNCEYADGVDNNGSSIGVGNGVANATAVPLGIGGTLDCNAGQTYPTDGIAASISVPAGFYDVAATFTFKK